MLKIKIKLCVPQLDQLIFKVSILLIHILINQCRQFQYTTLLSTKQFQTTKLMDYQCSTSAPPEKSTYQNVRLQFLYLNTRFPEDCTPIIRLTDFKIGIHLYNHTILPDCYNTILAYCQTTLSDSYSERLQYFQSVTIPSYQTSRLPDCLTDRMQIIRSPD